MGSRAGECPVLRPGLRSGRIADLGARATRIERQPPRLPLAAVTERGDHAVIDQIQRARAGRGVSASRTRVVIADGQALVRAGFRVLLEHDDRIRVVGEAATGEEAVEQSRRLHPDVVVVDAALPGLDCVEATGQMASGTGIAVMLLTTSEEDHRIFAVLRAGARGVLLKNAEPAELVCAVDALARGEAQLSPSFTRRLIAELASRPEPARSKPELLKALTPREREVVALGARGLSNREIAERLVVSPATAKTHVSRAMVKLGVSDRAKLVALAYEAGLVVPGPKGPLRRGGVQAQ